MQHHYAVLLCKRIVLKAFFYYGQYTVSVANASLRLMIFHPSARLLQLFNKNVSCELHANNLVIGDTVAQKCSFIMLPVSVISIRQSRSYLVHLQLLNPKYSTLLKTECINSMDPVPDPVKSQQQLPFPKYGGRIFCSCRNLLWCRYLPTLLFSLCNCNLSSFWFLVLSQLPFLERSDKCNSWALARTHGSRVCVSWRAFMRIACSFSSYMRLHCIGHLIEEPIITRLTFKQVKNMGSVVSRHMTMFYYLIFCRDTGDDDVAIQVLYCGICHSDLHTIKNDWRNASYPVVAGYVFLTITLS